MTEIDGWKYSFGGKWPVMTRKINFTKNVHFLIKKKLFAIVK